MNQLLELNDIFIWLQGFYLGNPLPPSDPIIPLANELNSKFVSFVLDGIYFYQNSVMNTSTNGSGMINYLSTYDPDRLNSLNIFFTEGGSGWAHATRGAGYGASANL